MNSRFELRVEGLGLGVFGFTAQRVGGGISGSRCACFRFWIAKTGLGPLERTPTRKDNMSWVLWFRV